MTEIPFEPQLTIEGSRTCGAAALTMVYRSLGESCEQRSVWRRVAEEIRPGVRAVRTHRLAQDARKRGFASVTLMANDPLRLLTRLSQVDLRAILNHRVSAESHLGHYSVLVGFDGREIELHDPYLGPHRVCSWNDFRQLWTANGPASEIVGPVLVAIGLPGGIRTACPRCGRGVPESFPCGRCGESIRLGPAGTIRCVAVDCPERVWSHLFCPKCDWAIVAGAPSNANLTS